MLYFASGSPISLYSMWQEELGMTHSQLSMVSMWYLLGTVVPLMFFSRISDHLGRRPSTILILLFSITGAMTFAMISNPEMIMVGRFIQGIASGLGSSTVAAYVVDLSQEMPRWVGPMITSSAPTLGLSTGAFVSGGLVTFTDISPGSYFYAVVALVVVILILVAFSNETMPRSRGLIASFKPRLGLPSNSGRLYAACTMIFVGTWAVGGFSQSFSATIVHDSLGYSNAFVSAVVFTSLLLPNALGSYFAKRFDVRAAQRVGLGIYVCCMILMFLCLKGNNLVAFCTVSVVAGLCQGVAFTAGVTALITRANKTQRASVFSMIYLTSYGGAAIPNLVVGLIPGEFEVPTIFSWYVILVAVMFVILLFLASRPYPDPEAESSEIPA